MRIKYAIVNGLMAVLIFVVNGVLTFATRKVMLPVLGSEIVGLTATFTDILSFLNLADMGISVSVGACLYEPIHRKQYSTIHGILIFFKRVYKICGCFFTATALIIAVGVHFVFRSSTIAANDAALYFLMTAATAGLSYFFSYRLIILSTDQKMFRLKIVNVLFRAVATSIKILSLIYFKSFTIYLATDILFTFLYLIAMNQLIKKAYSDIETVKPVLKNEGRQKIIKMIKGLFFHQIAGFAVFGTNNLYTAMFSGLTNAAILSNYQMVLTVISGVISNVFYGITASIGNLITSESCKKRYSVFKVIFFITSIIVITGSITFVNCVQQFIAVFYGKKYVSGNYMVLVLAAYFFLTSIRPATEQFKNAAGIFYEDRFVPIIEAIINAVACIGLGKFYGMTGVVTGNAISTLLVIAWQKPYMTFKYVFKVKLRYYFFDLFKYLLVGAICFWLTNNICLHIIFKSLWMEFIIKAFVSVFLCTAIMLLVFWRSNELKSIKRCALNILNRA